ncbi:MAG: hypothetical protein WC612_06700 [Bdellovibrionales bacterium]|jgi:hypothetical protein
MTKKELGALMIAIGSAFGGGFLLNNILYQDGYLVSKAAENKFKDAQQQINNHVLQSGSGVWTCFIAGKKLTIDGGVANNQADLRKVIEAGLTDGSCRARLTAQNVKPAETAPSPR